MHTKLVETEKPIEKALLVAVELARQKGIWSVEDSLEELRQLAQTAGAEGVGIVTQKLAHASPSHYVGRGKVEEIVELRDKLDYSLVIFDDELSPMQLRNMERELGVKVLDRTGLILDIFSQRARTREGRLQVELAQYEYLLPRLTRQWTHLSRQFGAFGVRGGPGETQLEVDRRRVRERITDLKREIEKVRRHRALYRQEREREGIPVVALVGYTNAGKSTLLNALTRAGVSAEDRLFDTLDPTTRRIKLPTGRTILLSDTVGFIQKLPTSVVTAFRATLEELAEADVLMHVLDITHDCGYEQSQTVAGILEELGLGGKRVVTVLNKIDRLVDEDRRKQSKEDGNLRSVLGDAWGPLQELVSHYPNGVAVSAALGWGLDSLLQRIQSLLQDDLVDITVRLPYSAGDLVALFHEKASITKRSYSKDGLLIRGKITQQLAPLFRKYVV